MALDITYVAGKDSMSFRLSNSDIEVSECLAQKGLEEEIGAILDVSDFGEKTPVNRELLAGAVDKLLSSINEDSELLPYMYSLRTEIPRGSGNYSSGTGIISGFKIDGESYLIEPGLDKCELSKRRQDSDGLWREYETRDVRGEKIIKTDGEFAGGFTIGDIIIERKKKPTKLLKMLGQLKSFLSNADAEIVEKILG